jgi:tetratricopeptide (TPR) repeat protein
MKSSLWIVWVIGVALVAGIVVYVKQKAPPPPTPIAESAPGETAARPPEIAEKEPWPAVTQDADEPAPVLDAAPDSNVATEDDPVAPALPSTPFSQAIATLISPKSSFQQKEMAWEQLKEAGELDQAIEVLKQGASENPTSAVYPATLGQAQLQKAGVTAQSGGSINEMGILGMEADRNFDLALELDPANWEAQFFKAAAISYWPLELNKGEEVIERLSSLIDQQDTMLPEPQFAHTYILLGEQYERMGRPDYAAATWLLGAQKFPGNPVLREKVRGR